MRVDVREFLHPRKRQTPQDYLQIRLANGTYTSDPDPIHRMPHREAAWLTALSPIVLIGRTLKLSLTTCLALGLVSGLAAGLHACLGSPTGTARAVSPRASLRTDRATVITLGVALMTSAILIPLLSYCTYPVFKLKASVEDIYISLRAWLLFSPFAVLLSAGAGFSSPGCGCALPDDSPGVSWPSSMKPTSEESSARPAPQTSSDTRLQEQLSAPATQCVGGHGPAWPAGPSSSEVSPTGRQAATYLLRRTSNELRCLRDRIWA